MKKLLSKLAARLLRGSGQMAVLFGELLELLGDFVVVTCDLLASGGRRARFVAFVVVSKLAVNFRLTPGFVLALLVPFDQSLMICRAFRVTDEFGGTAISFCSSRSA